MNYQKSAQNFNIQLKKSIIRLKKLMLDTIIEILIFSVLDSKEISHLNSVNIKFLFWQSENTISRRILLVAGH